jgi:hypothetical protein
LCLKKRRGGIYFRGSAGFREAALALLAELAKKPTNPLRAQHIVSGEVIARANTPPVPQAADSRFRQSS